MSRRLINVTTNRPGNDDFLLWNLDPDKVDSKSFPVNEAEPDKRILVLRGSVLGEKERDEHGRVVTTEDLMQFESEIKNFVSDAEEVGVLFHPDRKGENIDRMLDSTSVDLAFFRKYSTKVSHNPLYENYYEPLTKVRDGQAEKVWQKEEWEERFDKLWTFCLGDLVLEAKLNLLHKLLMPPADLSVMEDEAGAWSELLQVAKDDSEESEEDVRRYEDAWEKFEKEFEDADVDCSEKPLDEAYCGEDGPLNKLRDGLLSEAS
jgi:hypothetical protein